jgi:L-seryl-tRNA(Ser) seleniumtransferase
LQASTHNPVPAAHQTTPPAGSVSKGSFACVAARPRLCSNVAMTVPAKRAPSGDPAARLRQMPSLDELLQLPEIAKLCSELDRGFVVDIARQVLTEFRREIVGEMLPESSLSVGAIEARIVRAVRQELAPSLQPVINASGVVLHTNLGRAPLPMPLIEDLRRTVVQYSNLEYDLVAGGRGKRDVHCTRLLQQLTGAESAIVVNNCAAAVLVTLATLAGGGEVIVSRGELIEIGDGFRIPEIMEQSGAVLREVGTTNRTRLADYAHAINEKTRVLLCVHPSNFQMTGFTEKPQVKDLIALGQRSGLPVVEDLGAGCLVDLSAHGISEPTVRASVSAGFSLVLFSGDKLLGGPQAGIIAGKKDLVNQVRRHPLFRALRVDKLIITAMECTLRAYLRADWSALPAQRMIRLALPEIAERASKFLRSLEPLVVNAGVQFDIADGASLVGGGSTPAQSLPTKLLRVSSTRHSASQLESRLRRPTLGVPVIARIEDDRLLLDLRTVFPEQDAALVEALVAALW